MTKKREDRNKPEILIIDDNRDLLEALAGVLGDEGYSVITACNGVEGIKRTAESAPDLIILDLKMPEMDGIETLRRIRKTDAHVIVIILTAYGSAETAREGMDLNVHEYVSKPFNIEVVKSVVKEALASRRKAKDE